MKPGRWRDQQISGFIDLQHQEIILEQEKIMLNFVEQFQQARWAWQAPLSKFYDICAKKIQIVGNNHNAVILFGMGECSSGTLVEIIKQAVAQVDYAYVGINRYQIKTHNFDIDLEDSIEDSIDAIVKHCDPRFKRLATFSEVDGNHMVFSHPMDCYGLCRL
jgi:hypothetical protein